MKSIQESIKSKFFAIAVFYVIAIMFRYLTNKTSLLGYVDNSFLKIILQGIGPAIGAFIALKLFRLKSSYSLSGKLKPLIISLIVFVIVPVVGFAIIGVTESEKLTVSSNIFTAGAKLSFYFIIYAILEEIGWRAFLDEQLSFVNQHIKAFIVGSLWFVWHLNFALTTSNFVFFLVLILASWGIGKIGNITNSILAVGAFHAFYNLFIINSFETKEKTTVLLISATIWICYIVAYNKISKYVIGLKKLTIANNK